jgi:hypothetical protein
MLLELPRHLEDVVPATQPAVHAQGQAQRRDVPTAALLQRAERHQRLVEAARIDVQFRLGHQSSSMCPGGNTLGVRLGLVLGGALEPFLLAPAVAQEMRRARCHQRRQRRRLLGSV